MKFKHYIKESDTVNMIELAYFLDTYTLNEGIKDDISKGLKTMLNKLGLKAHKEKGLIQILIDSGKNTGKLFYHLFKYHTNRDDKHRERIREISSKVTKQNVIDVLLKLDVISLHILTGPIHTLNALTGWHISVDTMKNNVIEINDRAKKVITHISELIKDTVGETKKKLEIFLVQLKKNFKKSNQISSDVIKGV